MATRTQALALTAESFEAAFKQFYEPLCRYAYRLLRDEAQCEEVVQELFVKLWDKRESTQFSTSLKSYLYTAVHRSALDRLRHLKVRDEYQAYVIHVAERMHRDPEDQLEAAELEERVEDLVDELPDRCREVFLLSRKEQLSYAEIAERLSISTKTVEAQMGKALRHLREGLSDVLLLIFVLEGIVFTLLVGVQGLWPVI